MATPAEQVLCVTQGATDIRELFVFDANGLALTLNALDVVYLTVVDTQASGAAVISLTSADINQIEVVFPQTGDDVGKAYVKFQPSDTTALSVSSTRYMYDAWVQLATGERHQIIPLSRFVIGPRGTVIP